MFSFKNNITLFIDFDTSYEKRTLISWNDYIPIEVFVHLGFIIFLIGIVGLLSNKKNLLLSLISIELILFGANILLVALSVYLDDIYGQVGSILVLVLAGAESALALAIIVVYYKMFDNILIISDDFIK